MLTCWILVNFQYTTLTCLSLPPSLPPSFPPSLPPSPLPPPSPPSLPPSRFSSTVVPVLRVRSSRYPPQSLTRTSSCWCGDLPSPPSPTSLIMLRRRALCRRPYKDSGNTLLHIQNKTYKQNKQTNKQMNKQTNKQTHKWTNERTNKQTNEQTNERTNKKTSKQTNEQTNERANKQTNKQTNKW